MFLNQCHLTEKNRIFSPSFIERSQVQILKLSFLNCLHSLSQNRLNSVYVVLSDF
jgi:hypothetical protein